MTWHTYILTNHPHPIFMSIAVWGSFLNLKDIFGLRLVSIKSEVLHHQKIPSNTKSKRLKLGLAYKVPKKVSWEMKLGCSFCAIIMMIIIRIHWCPTRWCFSSFHIHYLSGYPDEESHSRCWFCSCNTASSLYAYPAKILNDLDYFKSMSHICHVWPIHIWMNNLNGDWLQKLWRWFWYALILHEDELFLTKSWAPFK